MEPGGRQAALDARDLGAGQVRGHLPPPFSRGGIDELDHPHGGCGGDGWLGAAGTWNRRNRDRDSQ